MSPGSTVIVEATSSRTMPWNIIVGRVVTPLWGDCWVPLKITNLSEKLVTLRRNRKLADVFPCLAVEDFELLQGFSHAQVPTSEKIGISDLKQRLKAVGLNDIDIDSCFASDTAKEKLVQLLENYNNVFSKHALDCGEVRDFVHHIHLTDECPFRLPYCRVPPAHYQKLLQALSEMEEQVSERVCFTVSFSMEERRQLKDLYGLQVEAIAKLSKADLMEEDGCTPSKKRTKVKTEAKAGTYRKLKPTDWTSKCDDALSKLKGSLLHSVVLAHPDCSLPLILSIDASLEGLSAVLSQIPAGEEKARPITFANKSLSNSQRRYPAHKLELLALKWSVCEKFSHWLKSHTFTVWTDNIYYIQYILTKAKLNACEQHWVSKLAAYTFDLKHIAGSKNIVAGALSRDPFTTTVSHRLITERYGSLLTEAESVDKDGVQGTFRLEANSLHVSSHSSLVSCDHTTVRTLLNLHNQWETVTELRAMQTVQSIQNVATRGADTLSAIPLEEIRQGQESDQAISKIIPYLGRKKRPSRREMAGMDAGALVLLKQWDRLKVQDGVVSCFQRSFKQTKEVPTCTSF
ncbi:hypothetical protein QQF64_011221 [Cirrhinus molitorella]|uniref:Reverse transcriptase/retrotransposon-derived protein RNase H-like domain-containing protein n=1 Tax=Cirrhinus molitorella TaxID=172907 RepID=A0ABR3LYL2_9TELE